MTIFVLGFAFHNSHVALIYKKHGPKPVIHKYNGIGGHVEPDETALKAMEREFEEETGVNVKGWERFCVLRVKAYKALIHCYRVRIEGERPNLAQKTDEIVGWHHLSDVRRLSIVPNLSWLIPMALDKDKLSGFIDDNTPG